MQTDMLFVHCRFNSGYSYMYRLTLLHMEATPIHKISNMFFTNL